MARRKYLTKTQTAVLRCFAQNNGRAEIYTGTRWSNFLPGRAHIFAQAFPHILHEGWITRKGQNAPNSYAWTDEGKLAYERGWYENVAREPHWLREQPDPAGYADSTR